MGGLLGPGDSTHFHLTNYETGSEDCLPATPPPGHPANDYRLLDYFSRGSSTSRSPSPSRFRPSTTATIATPGTVVTQWLCNM
jgi:hypothetical protein